MDDNISPTEADAIAWEAIHSISQKRICMGSKQLTTFLRNVGHYLITEKKDPNTNIIDQGDLKTYNFDDSSIQKLFLHLESCRLENTVLHFSEKQYSANIQYSGIMIDFDLKTKEKSPILTDKHYFKISQVIMRHLITDLNIIGDEFKFNVCFTIKEHTIEIKNDYTIEIKNDLKSNRCPLYKYGFHILIPNIMVSKPYKKYLFNKLKSDSIINNILAELGVINTEENPITDCLDQNSASVPVLFLGSCKRTGKPYNIGAFLELSVDLPYDSFNMPIIKKLLEVDLKNYNLVAELSLTHEANYNFDDADYIQYESKTPLIKKKYYDVKDELNISNILSGNTNNCRNADGGNNIDDDIADDENNLSILTLHNPEARYIHALLDLLDASYYVDRNKWRNVIFALANTSQQYKPIAIWFSMKSTEKYSAAALDELWDEAIQSKNTVENPLTVRSINHWAKTCNPALHKTIMSRTYFTLLTEYVYEHEGDIQHYMIAKILHLMIGKKFCVDVDGCGHYCWYEFVIPTQPMKYGEVWKWRKEIEPDDIYIYISEKLTNVCSKILEHLEEMKNKAKDENMAKYYVKLQKNFTKSRKCLFNNTFKNGVISEAKRLFRIRGFFEKLDSVPFLFGVANGVLHTGKKCKLINHFHEYPISRYSTITWKPYNSTDYWTAIVFNAICDIIIEPDARDWILYHASQGLNGGQKNSLYIFILGAGGNGKTTLLRWIAKTLHPYADKFNIQLMSSGREDADKPNSAMMKFKHLNWAYSEESNKSQALNVARMKEMVNSGEVSGRELNSKQETFTMKCNFVSASQYDFIVDTTDHGTWRRLRHYTAKAKFVKNPEPSNPFEKKEDPRFVTEYLDNPEFLSGMLSILTHYYEKLQNEYGGELKNVRSPTIEAETDIFRISQDSLFRWIYQNIVISPNCEETYLISDLAGSYVSWYNKNVSQKDHVMGEVIKELESSVLSKYIKKLKTGVCVLRNCRVLNLSESTELAEGEKLMSS